MADDLDAAALAYIACLQAPMIREMLMTPPWTALPTGGEKT